MTETLQKILADYGAIMFELDAAEGEVTDDIATKLASCEADLSDKVERIERLCESLNGTAKSVRERVGRLEQHARALENRAKNVHAWAISQLEAAGLDKYETDSFSLRRQKSPPRLDVTDEAALMAHVRQFHPGWIETVEKLDKKSVLDLVKVEGEIPGATLARGMHWRVS